MRALLLALGTSLLLMGCTPSERPSASKTATTATTSTPLAVYTAAPSATPNLIPAIPGWDAPPTTGIAHVDGIVAAIATRDAAALEPYITGQSLRCDGFMLLCPVGAPSGTPVRAVSDGACDAADVLIVDVADGRRPTTTRRAFADSIVVRMARVVGVWKSRASTWESERYVFHLVGTTPSGNVVRLWIDDRGVTARWVDTCGQATSAFFAGLASNHNVILAPPP